MTRQKIEKSTKTYATSCSKRVRRVNDKVISLFHPPHSPIWDDYTGLAMTDESRFRICMRRQKNILSDIAHSVQNQSSMNFGI